MKYTVKVKAGSSREEVFEVSENELLVSVHARAHDGEANEAVRKIIAEYFGVEYGYLIGSTDNTEIPAEQAELGVERDLELKKVRDLQDATQKLCRLTDESVRIIKGTINEAFRIDREKGMLKDKDAYSVSIRSKMLEG